MVLRRIHGEVNFITLLLAVTVEGQSSSVRFDSTADLSPVLTSDLIGFDTGGSALKSK